MFCEPHVTKIQMTRTTTTIIITITNFWSTSTMDPQQQTFSLNEYLTSLRIVLEYILVLCNFYIFFFFFSPTITFCCLFCIENKERQISYVNTRSYINFICYKWPNEKQSTLVCLSNNQTKCWEINDTKL